MHDMTIKDWQLKARDSGEKMANPFKSGSEICLAITEEVGEVAQEVALLEKVGTKATWQKEPSKERLANEITQLLNCVVALANHYDIDLGEDTKE